MDRDMQAMGLKSKLNDLQKDFVKVTKEGGKTVFTMTQEFMKQGFHTQKNLKYRVDMAGIMEGLTHFTEIGVALLEDETGLMDELASKGIMVGETFAGLLESQHKNLDISKQLHTSYKDIGKAGFSDLTKEAKKQYEEAKNLSEHRLKERRLLTEQIGVLKSKGKLSVKEKKDLQTMLKARKDSQELSKEQLDTAKANLETAERFKIMSQQSGAAVELISGPLDKAKSTLESMPFGKFISDFTGLGDHMETFKEGLAGSFKGFMDEENTIGKTGGAGLFNSVSMSANKMITDIQAGFGRLPGLLKTVNAAVGGMLGPLALIVAVLGVAFKVAQMFYGGMLETRKEFGLTFTSAAKLQSTINATTMEFKMMGVSAEDVKAGAQGIMDNLGGIGQVTRANLQTFASLNATLGLSGESAGVLASQMMAVGAGSIEAVGAQLESVGALAAANGVAPAKVLEDVAGASEAFANFAKDGGENVFKAAISARKLGISMETVAGTADALLDFESSINAQMEASMLTGRNINTDKARELALAGDLDGMQREITKQIGSAAEYEKLNVVQRKSLAAAFGVSVSELGKMVTNQDKLNNMTEAQVKRTDLIASLVQGLNSAWVAVMESLKPIIPLAIGILSPILLIVAAFAGVIVIVGKVLAMFNKLSVGGIGLGDVVMFITGVFIAYRMAMKLAWVQSKMNWVMGTKLYKQTIGRIANKIREIATDKMALVMKKLNLKITRNQYAWSWKNIGANMKLMAIKVKDIALSKAKRAGELIWMGIQAASSAVQTIYNMVQSQGIVATLGFIAAVIWKNVVMAATTVATWAVTAATWAFNAALTANPIGLIVMGVVALIVVIAILIKKFGLFKVVKVMLMAAFLPLILIIGVFKLIYKGVASLVERLGGIGQVMKYVGAAFLVVMGPIGWLIGAGILIYKNFDKIKEVVSAVGKSIFDFMMKPINFVLNGIKSMVEALGGFKNMAMTALKIAFWPLFLAWEIFQKMKSLIGKIFGGGGAAAGGGGAAAGGGGAPAPEMHSGGMVTGTGTATVQKGEAVLTEQQQGSMMSTQAMESKLDELIQLMGQQGPIALGVNQTKVNTARVADSIV